MNPQEEPDYDKIYGGVDIDESTYRQPEKIKRSYSQVFRENLVERLKRNADIVKQVAKEGTIGLGGSYGNILDFFGLQPTEPSQSQQDQYQREFDILGKDQPNIGEFLSLSDDDVIPNYNRLPSSQDLEQLNEMIGGPGEGQYQESRTAGRMARIYGSGLPFGVVNPIPSILAGAAGQTIEELGGGPIPQAVGEIGGLLAGGPPRQLASKIPEEQQAINELKNLGYTDKEINLALKAPKKGGKLGKVATKSSKTQQAFDDIIEKSEKAANDIVTDSIPGIEKGTQHVHQVASDFYGDVAKQAADLKIKDPFPFLKATTDVISELKNTLGKNPEASPFLNRIYDAGIAATKNTNGETFINFYKELNNLGKWMGRSQKDRLITKMKEGIKDTFRANGPEGKALAENFERANKGIQKAYAAEEAYDLLQKANTAEGYNWNAFKKIFDKEKNWETLRKALGEKQTNNLYRIAKTGKEIKDFDKAYKGIRSKLGDTYNLASSLGAGYYILHGDLKTAAIIMGAKGSQLIGKKLAEMALTNPKFQNLQIRALDAIKNNSPQLFQRADQAIKKYLEEEGIPVDNY